MIFHTINKGFNYRTLFSTRSARGWEDLDTGNVLQAPLKQLTFSLRDSPTFNKAALPMCLLLFFIRTDIKNYNCLQGKDTILGITKGFGFFLAFLFVTKTLAHFISVHASQGLSFDETRRRQVFKQCCHSPHQVGSSNRHS